VAVDASLYQLTGTVALITASRISAVSPFEVRAIGPPKSLPVTKPQHCQMKMAQARQASVVIRRVFIIERRVDRPAGQDGATTLPSDAESSVAAGATWIGKARG